MKNALKVAIAPCALLLSTSLFAAQYTFTVDDFKLQNTQKTCHFDHDTDNPIGGSLSVVSSGKSEMTLGLSTSHTSDFRIDKPKKPPHHFSPPTGSTGTHVITSTTGLNAPSSPVGKISITCHDYATAGNKVEGLGKYTYNIYVRGSGDAGQLELKLINANASNEAVVKKSVTLSSN